MATPHHTIDRVGGWLSLACAVHCAVVPIAVLLAALGLPVASGLALFDDGRFELGFSIAAVIFVAISLGLGWRSGGDRRPMVIGFGLGLALIGGAHLIPGAEWISHLVLVAGATTVALTHRRSLRAAQACCEDPGDDEQLQRREGAASTSAPASAALLP